MSKIYKRSNQAIIAVMFTMLLSSMAFGRGWQPRGVGQPFDLRILFQALDATIDCNFHVAKYKVRTVKILTRLKRGPGIKVLKQILEKAEDVYNDPGLTPMEKFQIGTDCLSQAVPILVHYYSTKPGQKGKLGAALNCLKLAKKLAKAAQLDPGFFALSIDTLQETLDVLHTFRAPKIQVAAEAIEIAIEKMSDPYLSKYEKLEIVNDCFKVAAKAIKSSRVYKNAF